MKILFTADWHIGKGRNLPNYLHRTDLMLQSIYEVVVQKKPDYLVVIGDVCDSLLPREEERNLLLSFLVKFVKLTKVILVEGNHDWYKNNLSLLAFYKHLNKLNPNIRVVTDTELVSLDSEHDLLCIPCRQDMTAKKFKKLVTSYKTDKKFYVAMHEAVQSITDLGRNIDGMEIPNLKWISAIYLGDIHRYQKVGNRAWYCGPPMQTDFGEALPKGVILHDCSTDKHKFIELNKAPPLITVKEGEPIPKEGLVRYLGSSDTALPDNVVSHTPTISKEESITLEELSDITSGLVEFLAERGLSQEQQESAILELEAIK